MSDRFISASFISSKVTDLFTLLYKLHHPKFSFRYIAFVLQLYGPNLTLESLFYHVHSFDKYSSNTQLYARHYTKCQGPLGTCDLVGRLAVCQLKKQTR